MRYKNKLDKKNIIYITVIILISILTLLGIFYLKQYLFALIFILLVILLLHIYINTTYEINDEYFIVRYGFIKMKFKYENIKSINLVNDKIYLRIGLSDFILNIDDSKKVMNELKKRSN